MLSLEKDVEMLRDFGLTTNQAKVYLALVRLGYASVGRIAKESMVRREDVYRILPKLQKMGLVEKLLGKPVKIRATPVDEALSVLIKHEEETVQERLEEFRTKKEVFLKRFKKNKIKPELEGELGDFVYLSERHGIIGRMLMMIKTAEREIDLVCSRSKLMQFLYEFAEPLKKAIKRKVSVRVVSEISEYEHTVPRILEEYLSPKNFVDLKYTSLSSSHYIITDSKQALIATTTEGNLAENPCLWTSSKNLVEVLQGNFEDLWHSSFSWKSVQVNKVPEKVVDFVKGLRPTNHVIFVYDSKEAKRNVLFSYLKFGLESGEMVVYVTAEESIDEIREAMQSYGINVEKYGQKGALRILNYNEIYIIDGEFNINMTMSVWNKLYGESLAKGFNGMRVTGEMSCFFKHNLLQELLEYESALHRVLEIPMIAICAYSASALNESKDPVNLYTELVKAHSTVLFAGIDNKLGKIEIRKA